jgi:hypothetical protein
MLNAGCLEQLKAESSLLRSQASVFVKTSPDMTEGKQRDRQMHMKIRLQILLISVAGRIEQAGAARGKSFEFSILRLP